MATPQEALLFNSDVIQAPGVETIPALALTAGATLSTKGGRLVAADTTDAAFTILLPASPYDGEQFAIYDSATSGSWNTNNLTIDGNGASIVAPGAAPAGTLVLAARSGFAVLRYDATSTRWHVLAQAPSDASGLVTLTGTQTLTNKTLTSPTLTNALVSGVLGLGAPQALSGAGAVSAATSATLFTSTGSAQALTLADGTVAGQFKFIIHVVDGGSGVLTPTTKTGFTTLTLTAVYDWGALIWDGSAWRALAYGGTAAFA